MAKLGPGGEAVVVLDGLVGEPERQALSVLLGGGEHPSGEGAASAGGAEGHPPSRSDVPPASRCIYIYGRGHTVGRLTGD